jgi:hypothetical protein
VDQPSRFVTDSRVGLTDSGYSGVASSRQTVGYEGQKPALSQAGLANSGIKQAESQIGTGLQGSQGLRYQAGGQSLTGQSLGGQSLSGQSGTTYQAGTSGTYQAGTGYQTQTGSSYPSSGSSYQYGSGSQSGASFLSGGIGVSGTGNTYPTSSRVAYGTSQQPYTSQVGGTVSGGQGSTTQQGTGSSTTYQGTTQQGGTSRYPSSYQQQYK